MAKKSSSPSVSLSFNPGVLVALGLAYFLYLRPRMLRFGTQPGEAEGQFPGDDAIGAPNFQSTRAITIDAPPETVWPWLAQMGREHTGFYGLDKLTNHGLPSLAYLRDDLPAPTADLPMNNGYRILKVVEGQMLCYGSFDLPTWLGEPMELTTLIQIQPGDQGGTRLLIRTRAYTYGSLAPAYNLAYEVFDYFHAMAQLKNIKLRAETLTRLRKPSVEQPVERAMNGHGASPQASTRISA